MGALLTERLAASEEIKQVIAIDERRGECAAAQWHILDVRDPSIADKLRGADVVVHLALDLDLGTDPAARTAYNVRGTQTVLTAAAAAGVHRVVLCTSAMVYGALPDNELPLSEDAELRATAEATGVGDLLEIERLARRAPRAHPGLNVTVVRPAILVGGTDTALTRYFESPRLLVVAGSRPAWQFCHVEDLCSALEYAVLEKVDGELAVGCDGWLEQEEVEQLSGIRRMELPSAVALGAAARLHRIGLTPSPAGDLAYTMYPWVVSGSRLHDAGWRPGWTNEEVLAELLEEVAGRHTVAGRRLGRKDATAAGAAGGDGGVARCGGRGAAGAEGAAPGVSRTALPRRGLAGATARPCRARARGSGARCWAGVPRRGCRRGVGHATRRPRGSLPQRGYPHRPPRHDCPQLGTSAHGCVGMRLGLRGSVGRSGRAPFRRYLQDRMCVCRKMWQFRGVGGVGHDGGMASTLEHPGEQAAPDPVKLIAVRDTPLSLDEVFRAVGDDAAGGTALFVGTVRNHDGGADVDALGYSCHPSAEAEMRRIAEKVVADYPVRALAAVHRVGDLRVGGTWRWSSPCPARTAGRRSRPAGS
ncbi:hypothetical protein GCM10020256_24400 [Streptomyces thermocoprophilus]